MKYRVISTIASLYNPLCAIELLEHYILKSNDLTDTEKSAIFARLLDRGLKDNPKLAKLIVESGKEQETYNILEKNGSSENLKKLSRYL